MLIWIVLNENIFGQVRGPHEVFFNRSGVFLCVPNCGDAPFSRLTNTTDGALGFDNTTNMSRFVGREDIDFDYVLRSVSTNLNNRLTNMRNYTQQFSQNIDKLTKDTAPMRLQLMKRNSEVISNIQVTTADFELKNFAINQEIIDQISDLHDRNLSTISFQQLNLDLSLDGEAPKVPDHNVLSSGKPILVGQPRSEELYGKLTPKQQQIKREQIKGNHAKGLQQDKLANGTSVFKTQIELDGFWSVFDGKLDLLQLFTDPNSPEVQRFPDQSKKAYDFTLNQLRGMRAFMGGYISGSGSRMYMTEDPLLIPEDFYDEEIENAINDYMKCRRENGIPDHQIDIVSTACNILVGRIIENKYGISDFRNQDYPDQFLNANAIYEYLVNTNEGRRKWTKVGMANSQDVLVNAQRNANFGRVVIAIEYKPGANSEGNPRQGHIKLILGGKLISSDLCIGNRTCKIWKELGLFVPNSGSFFVGAGYLAHERGGLYNSWSNPNNIEIFVREYSE